jgi:hypothetical protein
VGAQARNIIFRGWRRLFDCLPGSQASTWLEPGMISHGATILFCFAWLLSFPMWGDVDGPACRPRQTMNYSWQARVYSPLTGVIMSHHIVHVGAAIDCLSGGVQSPQDELSALVLTTWVLGRSNLLRRSQPLPRKSYPMSKWSCRLCMFSWSSH